jgi:hypothetical protein
VSALTQKPILAWKKELKRVAAVPLSAIGQVDMLRTLSVILRTCQSP